MSEPTEPIRPARTSAEADGPDARQAAPSPGTGAEAQAAAPEQAAESAETAENAVPAEQPRVGWLPGPAGELFGEGATAEEAYGLLTVDVPAHAWIPALETARDTLGCTYFDWLSAVDEPGEGFRIAAHVVALGRSAGQPGPGGAKGVAEGAAVHRLLVRTTVPHDAPALPTATGVYAGAAWHERETHEMFGVEFTGHPHLVPLLLPEGFEGHPLRKDFVLAARVAKAWPGAKEPGESDHGGPKRRQMLPPGVPDPNEWGPLKGQLPPAPARPARAARAAGAGAAGERPARRTRTAAEGSASRQAAGPDADAERPARRARSASEGSASQREAEGAAGPATPDAAERPARRTRTAAEGSASQRTEGTAAPTAPARRPRSADAPWHHAKPAFEDSATEAGLGRKPGADEAADAGRPAPTEAGRPAAAGGGEAGHGPGAGTEAGTRTQTGADAEAAAEAAAGPDTRGTEQPRHGAASAEGRDTDTAAGADVSQPEAGNRTPPGAEAEAAAEGTEVPRPEAGNRTPPGADAEAAEPQPAQRGGNGTGEGGTPPARPGRSESEDDQGGETA